MADGQPRAQGGFVGTLKSKWGPLPVWGWLALVTVILLGYWLYQQHKQGSQAQQPTPSSVGQPGVVVINQDEPGGEEPPEPPEKKRKHRKHKDKDEDTRKITVGRDETLGQLARQRHWSQATLKEVEEMNLTEGKGEWTPSTRLHKGETVIRPLKS